jgi:hypothetical protein
VSLPWLSQPFERVLAIHEQGRLPHGMLIRAGHGWGEVAFANQLALALIGRTDAEDARTLAHPDLRWVAPEGSVIKVDQIRELAEFAVGTRQSAPCKVAVIEAAECLNDNAANALLKTLEEPPPDNYLLLTSSRPARLLPTIVSRCQVVALERNNPAAMEWLSSRWSEAEIEQKFFECGAAPLTVDEALAGGEPALGPLLRRLAGSGSIGSELADILEWDTDRLTGAWYRHCLAVLAGDSRIHGLRYGDARRFSDFVDELNSIRYQLLMTNSANQRLLYERLASRWRNVTLVD